eukprot:TRINITY_DN17065_c0_g1_i2.p1 TRINITY_DN17065_c0_g1~~TRINITY_DN17065_c0_g1_i2.p1  ORF type:complete len:581 (-),score=49.36 TRINITY_DN17065_c0_g1_i2:4-1674(-)
MPLPDGLAQEVSECVRQEIRNELGEILTALQTLGQEFGKSLQHFLEHVHREKSQVLQQKVSNDADADSSRNSAAPTVLESASFPVVPVKTDISKIAVVPAEPSAPALPPLTSWSTQEAFNPDIWFENIPAELDWSVRPAPSHDPLAVLPVYAKQTLHNLIIAYDGHGERVTATWDITLTWPDTRLEGHSTETLPKGIWAPFGPHGIVADRAEGKPDFLVGVVPNPLNGWAKFAKVEPPNFCARGHFMTAAGYGNGPWLQQRVTGIPLDHPLDAFDEYKNFPSDARAIHLFFSAWALEYIGGEMKQMINLLPDGAPSNASPGGASVTFRHKPGGVEWRVLSVEALTGYHTSLQSGRRYPDLYVSLYLQRRSTFYFWKAQFPLLIALVMECFVFSVSPVSDEGIAFRLSSSVAVFFSVLAIQMASESHLPKSSKLTKLDNCSFAVSIFLVAVMLQSALLHVATRRGLIPVNQVDLFEQFSDGCIVFLLGTYLLWLEISVWRAVSKFVELNRLAGHARGTFHVEDRMAYEVTRHGSVLSHVELVSHKSACSSFCCYRRK